MANLNLSQFTEKTLVADADWVFVWDTAGAISKKVSRNSLLNSGTLATSAPVTISQTWAAVGQTFKALVVDAAGTSAENSAAASLLLDLQVGGVSKFNVNKAGSVATAGPLSAGSINVGSAIVMSVSGAAIRASNGTFINLGSGDTSSTDNFANLFLRSSALISFGGNTKIQRDDADNTLALRNGAAAQTFRVYNTYTDASSYERGGLTWASNKLSFDTAAAGGGTRRSVALGGTDNAVTAVHSLNAIFFTTNSVDRWTVQSSGNLFAAADNTYDIGASTGNRPRDIFLKGTLYSDTIRDSTLGVLSFVTTGSTRMTIGTTGNVGIGTTAPSSKLHVAGDASISGNISLSNGSVTVLGARGFTLTPGDGIFQFLNNAQTGFDRIQLGGASTGHPAIKRNGASIDITLASDGITFTSIQDLYRRFGAGSPEGVVIAPTGAVYHNTSGGAATTFYVKESSPTPSTGWVGK